MIQNILKSMHTQFGKYIISLILGIGLASLFRKACNERNCLVFRGPAPDVVRKTIYKHNDKCYKFREDSTSCGKAQRVVTFA
jgi:hypothetical protein